MADPRMPAAAQPQDRRAGPQDSAFETRALEHTLARHDRPHWPGWRRRALVVAALLVGAAWLGWVHWLAAVPHLDGRWSAGPGGTLVLQASRDGALQAHRGGVLTAVSGDATARLAVDAALLGPSPRWQVEDDARARQVAQQEGLAATLAAGPVRLHFAAGSQAALAAEPRGWTRLGWPFWPLAGLALALLLSGVAVLLGRPRPLSLLYAALAACQAGQLAFTALATLPGLGLPPGALAHEMAWRMALDGVAGAAAVTALARYPTRLPGAGWIAVVAWGVVAVGLSLAQAGVLAPLWWWAQALCLALAGAALAVATDSYRREPHPQALVMRRFAAATLATGALVTAATALAAAEPEGARGATAAAAAAWHVFLSSLLLLAPFLAHRRAWLREFALLAGVGTVAASLHLLLAGVLALDRFTALALVLFGALGGYTVARPWLLARLAGNSVLTTEHAFELLFRAAREVQAQPARLPILLKRLLRELFDPLDVRAVDRVPARTRVVGGGSALVVPVPGADDGTAPASALALRYAQHGRRLFTADDAQLVDRVLDQLRRAVAYDRAVERGRHEERLRIAQDLHDDIGARLLTLMYQAPTPEMEDYLRHTLQDLKTLTRGLAAAEHRLSHAAVEWKADLAQRLAAAQAELGWSFSCDRDLRLSMVQWSALTRVLRELVSNALYHGHASRVDVRLSLEGGRLLLQVADDGRGRDPQHWAHGLGLGGVRKRVKQLGGEVRWSNNEPRGIVCDVRLDGFGTAP